MKDGSILTVVSCSSHKSKGPAHSISAAEMQAADEAIDEVSILAHIVLPYSIQLYHFTFLWTIKTYSRLYQHSATLSTSPLERT